MIENNSRRFGRYYDGMFLDFEEPEYYLICDKCGKKKKFDDLNKLFNYRSKWKKEYLGDDCWIDICNECMK